MNSLFDEENLDLLENNDNKIEQQTQKVEISIENTKDIEELSLDSDFQALSQFTVDSNWRSSYAEMQMSHEVFEIKKLQDNIYNLFVNADFYPLYKNGERVSKQNLLSVFLYFYDKIDERERYSETELFIEIADFMNMNYDVLYEILPIPNKYRLLKDMNVKYGIFSNKKFTKLF